VYIQGDGVNSFTGLHVIIFQKRVTFVVAAVRTLYSQSSFFSNVFIYCVQCDILYFIFDELKVLLLDAFELHFIIKCRIIGNGQRETSKLKISDPVN
jgi:hypothetical protein